MDLIKQLSLLLVSRKLEVFFGRSQVRLGVLFPLMPVSINEEHHLKNTKTKTKTKLPEA